MEYTDVSKFESIMESYSNGQKRQFADMVVAYGPDEFAGDLEISINSDTISAQQAFKILKSFIIVNGDV